MIRYICDRVALILHGAIVETGTAEQVFETPASAYARQLIAAMPDVSAAIAGR